MDLSAQYDNAIIVTSAIPVQLFLVPGLKVARHFWPQPLRVSTPPCEQTHGSVGDLYVGNALRLGQDDTLRLNSLPITPGIKGCVQKNAAGNAADRRRRKEREGVMADRLSSRPPSPQPRGPARDRPETAQSAPGHADRLLQ